MKGLICHASEDVRYQDWEDPKITNPDDVIVRMTKSALCGSDLHIYHNGPMIGEPFPIGHESIGEVLEVGADIRKLKPGDKVFLPASSGCGSCRPCRQGIVNACETYGGFRCYGLGELSGCQTEKILVPHGDYNALPIPEGVTDAQALLLTDILPTAYMGCLNADVSPGKSVLVIGLGPVGLLAVECAFVMGANRVFAMDLVPERREVAKKLGAIIVDAENAAGAIPDANNGRNVDCVIDVVGVKDTISLAMKLAAQQGSVSELSASIFEFSYPVLMNFVKGLTFRISVCSVPQYLPVLIPLVQSGRLTSEFVFSHTMKLSEGAKAYEMFEKREKGVMKIILEP